MIEINSPCHQNFNNMPVSGNGRYCSSCEKIVVDFTNMSKKELHSYFENYSGASICGRVKKFHLGKQNAFEAFLLNSKQFILDKVNIKPLRIALLGLISGLLTFTTSCIMGKMRMPAEKTAQSNNDTITVKNPNTKKN